MSNEDLAEYFKTFSGLTVGQGKTRLKPRQNNNTKAFTHWVKDQYILVIYPTGLPLTDTHTAELLIRAKSYQLFLSKSDAISKAANPVRLTK